MRAEDSRRKPLTLGDGEKLCGQILLRIQALEVRLEEAASAASSLIREANRLAQANALRLDEVLAAVAELSRRPAREPSGCLGDVLAVMRAAGKRLTTAAVLDALAAAGKEWSESTVRHTLAAAVDAGILVNDQARDCRGYGLP